MTTKNGLNRYDGYDFMVYDNQSDNLNKIKTNYINRVFLSKAGHLVLYSAENFQIIEILNPQTNESTQINLALKTTKDSQIRTVEQMDDGTIYLITENKDGFSFFYYEKGDFHQLWVVNEARPTNPYINDYYTPRFHFQLDKEDILWFYDREKGLSCRNKQGEILQQFSSRDFEDLAEKEYSSTTITFLVKDTNDQIWLAFDGVKGVYRYDSAINRFEKPSFIPQALKYTHAWTDKKGNVIFFGEQAEKKFIFLVEPTEKLQDYSHFFTFISGYERTIGKDFQKLFYILSSNGVRKVSLNHSQVRNYLGHTLEKGDFGISARGIVEDKFGNILFSTEENGWFRLPAKQQKEGKSLSLHPINFDNQKSEDLQPPAFCRNFVTDAQGFIWASSFKEHIPPSTPEGYLLKYHPKNQQMEHYLCPYRINCMTIGQDNLIWIATRAKVLLFDPSSEKFSEFAHADGHNLMITRQTNYILGSKDGFIWIATNDGLLKINPQKEQWTLLKKEHPDLNFTSNDFLTIHEAPDGLLWLGTAGGGIHIFNPKTNEVKLLTTADGLVNNTVCGIIQETNGNYWFSTYNGLSYFDIQTQTFRNFNINDGFNHNEFNRFAFFKDSKDQLYFGGMNGFNVFKSEDLLKTPTSLQLFLSEIAFFDKVKSDIIQHKTGIQQLEQVDIPAQNRYLKLKLGLSDYTQPELNRFAYFLEGFDKEWQQLGHDNEFTFNHLPSGKFTLHLKGANYRGHWTAVQKIQIHVHEFFYKTWWFFGLCLSAASLLAFAWIYRLRLEKERLETLVLARTQQIREDKKIIEQQAVDLKALDTAKSQFFANISHEFRTPLTLIQGFARETTKKAKSIAPSQLIYNLDIIRQNSDQLLTLVNQILDLSKLEVGQLQVAYQNGNVIPVFDYADACFQILAKPKAISLILETEQPIITMDFDKEKLLKIVFNLLSNAINPTCG